VRLLAHQAAAATEPGAAGWRKQKGCLRGCNPSTLPVLQWGPHPTNHPPGPHPTNHPLAPTQHPPPNTPQGYTAMDIACSTRNVPLLRRLEQCAPFAGWLQVKVPQFGGLGSAWQRRWVVVSHRFPSPAAPPASQLTHCVFLAYKNLASTAPACRLWLDGARAVSLLLPSGQPSAAAAIQHLACTAHLACASGHSRSRMGCASSPVGGGGGGKFPLQHPNPMCTNPHNSKPAALCPVCRSARFSTQRPRHACSAGRGAGRAVRRPASRCIASTSSPQVGPPVEHASACGTRPPPAATHPGGQQQRPAYLHPAALEVSPSRQSFKPGLAGARQA
jgi:hypothetical protein